MKLYTNDKPGLLVLAFIITVAITSCVLWGVNIYKLIGSDFDPLTGMVVARVIGVFVAPLGAILGVM